MAGLRGLMILLVLMVGLACCEESKTISPPHTGAGSPAPVAASPPSISTAPPVATSKPSFLIKPTLTSLSATSNPPSSSTKTIVGTTPPSISKEISVTKQPSSQTNPSPANISNETSITNQSSSQSTPSPHPNTTKTATTAEPKTDPKCSYSVENVKFGLKINMTNSAPADYIIYVAEVGGPFERKGNFSSTSKNSSHDIKLLKPCTEYELRVTFSGSNGTEISCNKTENTITSKTTGMTKEEIKNGSCSPGYFCYQSDWNISKLLSRHNKVSIEDFNNGSYRFKHAYDDMCSDLVLKFPTENCSDATFTISENFNVDFIIPNDINQTKPDKLPAKINATLPSSCKDLRVEYKCSGINNDSVELSDMKPFTNYSCTGDIKMNNVSINKTLPLVQFNINCDFTVNNLETSSTNTSIELNWETMSNNCQNVLNKLDDLSYHCSCQQEKGDGGYFTMEQRIINRPEETTCVFTRGIKPFRNYRCKVHSSYTGRGDFRETRVEGKTKSGIPEQPHNVVVTVPENNKIEVTCSLNYMDFNGPDGKFSAKLQGVTGSRKESKTCQFKFEDLSYLTTYRVEVFTVNRDFTSSLVSKQADTKYNDKALIGFLVFLIIITSVALLLVLYKIYVLKNRKSHDLTENMSLIAQGNDEDSLMPVEPIPAELLLETYKRKLADEARLFLGEFQSIPRIFSRYVVKEAKKGCNAPKNRYVDILPYDYNRVQLATGNGEAGCDYINASFIDGYKEPKKYIAAQGPKDETVSDFWRMVWEQQSSIIVMVTRCEEGNRIKCAQYWPSLDRETELYEEFIVKLTSEEHCPDYTIRHLSLSNKREKNLEREVTHIQFMSWPDHGVPGEPHLLLKLRRRVNAFKNVFSGPIVVHCSAGVGRTGTYIGIDAMMEGLEAEGRMDIYGYVVQLRRQRCLMVQVEAQYILIHQALLEHNQFGETEIALSELHSMLNTLKQKNSDSEPTLMEEEFERLPSFKNWRTCNIGMTEENKKMNRSSSVIPYDYNRVLLRTGEDNSQDSEVDDEEPEDSSDEEDEDSIRYINASHINGYWGSRSLIAAQDPLPDSFTDFWSMVHQKKLSTIVMLSEHKEDGEPLYWRKEKKTFGDFEVEVSSTEITPVFITRTMLVRHVKRKDSRQVKHFQFLKWEGTGLPEKPQELVDLAKEVQRSCVGSKSQRMPILVHCNDGSTRSGIFCGLWNLLDSAETEKLVDVFQVVKTLRKDRKGMITSLEQYQFLYKALEGAFPVQNGEVKQVKSAAVASVEIVNETKAAEAEKQPEEKKAEEPASTTSSNQQAEAESTPLVAESEKEKKEEEPAKESTPQEESSNGPTVTVEV
ncbi:receptor-type tyrosine-protein phosphatase C isoform X2 [Xiphophorus couchianus]|uniref:receptor-type tyrosine-protein phosphatase C isoform X2 n=1 Tax=Xiphophorus couchianus TaxID=32473 RepID=UPI0010166EDD|nr:receptor-type tyrosine-protein phosphatase C isoform X2 [Xiphophorus couchianus]